MQRPDLLCSVIQQIDWVLTVYPYRVTILALSFLVIGIAPQQARTRTVAAGAMLPDRYLQCVLGRSTNLDPSKRQKTSEIISEGRYSIALRLPPIPVRTGEPPEPNDPPEPVDPRTRIVSDPDGLATGVSPNFLRVADLWPKRVEMIATIPGSTWLHMMIIDSINPAKQRAHLFIARVKDAATMDLKRVYQGECKISDPPRQVTRR